MIEARAAIARQQKAAFSLEPVRIVPPGPGEVLVRMVASGICHTDLGARDGYFPIPQLPVILGHEGAGIVEAVGKDVTTVQEGDHVVLSFAYCGHCSNCRRDMPYLCAQIFPLNFSGLKADGSCGHSDHGGSPVGGSFFGQSSFATYSITRPNNLIVVPRDIPLTTLAPLGCGIQTGAGTVLNALKPSPGDSIAVFGCGAVGLSAIMAAGIAGCTSILAVDRNPLRLATARKLGATQTFDASPDVAAQIIEASSGGVRFSIEAAGVPQALRQAVDCLASPGTCALISGVPQGTEVALDMAAFLIGKSLIGVVEGASVPQRFIPELIDHYRAGRFPIDQLITLYPFAHINQALEDSVAGSVIKPVVTMD